MSLEKIRKFIDNNYSSEIERKVEDDNYIWEKYSLGKKYETAYSKFRNSLIKNISVKLDENDIRKAFQDYHEIPPGIKGVMRGNKFRDEYYEYIDKNLARNEKYRSLKIFKEKKTGTKYPKNCDIVIEDKNTGKSLGIECKLDCWTGGHQSEAGLHGLDGTLTEEKTKIIRAICRKPKTTIRKNSKVYHFFQKGIENNCISYSTNIMEHINLWFGL